MGTAELQGDLWGAHAEDWAGLQEIVFVPLYARLLGACEVREGTRLLDVGCGAGLAMMTAQQLGAKVTGLDAAPALIAIAQRRMPNAGFHIGDQEQLPFADEAFDVVTGFNSFQYAADPVRALGEAKRVTKRGGLVVAAIWGDPEECELRGYITALGRLGPPPPPGAPGPWALSPPGALEALLEQAKLAIWETGSVDVPFAFRNEDEALSALLAAGPAERAVRHSGRDVVAAAVAEAIAPFRGEDGNYLMNNRFRYVIAKA